ncbi:MAG: hypothetical protein KAW12_13400 [Candidatus Aminicenantes bacterium]|nr:hypothetical protein [Candidatus Aminicenantes bacterium]
MKYKLKSIKFWFAAVVMVVATVFVPLGYLSGAYWFATVTFVGNGYFFANILAKKYTKKEAAL